MKQILSVLDIQHYIKNKYTTDTLFNTKRLGIIPYIKKYIDMLCIYCTKYLLQQPLYIETHSTSDFSQKIHNTVSPLIAQGLLGSITTKKIGGTNLFKTHSVYRHSTMQGSTGNGMGLSEEISVTKAMGEFIERYECILSGDKKDTLKEFLYNNNKKMVDPKKFDYFMHYAHNPQPLLWTKGYDAHTHTPLYIPAHICYFDLYNLLPKNDIIFYQTSSNGVACYQSFLQAADRAVLELIERDAFILHWHLQLTPTRIDPDTIDNDELKHYIQRITSLGHTLYILDITVDIPVPTVAVILFIKDSSAYHITLATDYNIENALQKVLEETIIEGEYSEDYTPEKKEGIHSMDDIYSYWFYNKNQKSLMSFLWKGKEQSLSDVIKKYNTTPKNYTSLLTYLQSKDIELYLVDQSSHLSRYFDLSVVRALSPQLIQIYFGNQHKYDISHPRIKQYIASNNLHITSINPEHHPFL